MAGRDLRTLFDELPDHRVACTRKHNLVDIVLLVLIATLLGVEGADDIRMYGKTVRGAARVGEPNLHLVNAWLANNELVLGQHATDAKSNQIRDLQSEEPPVRPPLHPDRLRCSTCEVQW